MAKTKKVDFDSVKLDQEIEVYMYGQWRKAVVMSKPFNKKGVALVCRVEGVDAPVTCDRVHQVKIKDYTKSMIEDIFGGN